MYVLFWSVNWVSVILYNTTLSKNCTNCSQKKEEKSFRLSLTLNRERKTKKWGKGGKMLKRCTYPKRNNLLLIVPKAHCKLSRQIADIK